MGESWAYFEFRQRFFIVGNICILCILFCCTVVVHFYVKISCHLCEGEMQFCNSLTDNPTNVKIVKCTWRGWSHIAQFSRCGRSDWCASEDNGKVEKRFKWYTFNAKGQSRFVRALWCINSLVISMKVLGSTRQFDTPHKWICSAAAKH